jgi:alpha-tubulin suppressor-like RCC1 family protein
MAHHSLVIDNRNSVMVCGRNSWGQLGLNHLNNQFSLVRLELPEITSVSANLSHSLLLDIHGNVWACGSNGDGQLGIDPAELAENDIYNEDDDSLIYPDPLRIPTLYYIKAIAAGGLHSLFLNSHGEVFSCGRNTDGQLGYPTSRTTTDRHSSTLLLEGCRSRYIPAPIPNLPSIKNIACGSCHSVFLDSRNRVWSCGYNSHGQLGVGDYHNRWMPVFLELPPIDKLACGSDFTLMLDTGGQIWSCGNNRHGQLGLGDCINRSTPSSVVTAVTIVSVACGSSHFLVIDTDHQAWACGCNDVGQLGLPGRSTNLIHQLLTLKNIKAISAGACHSLFIDMSGYMWACGQNFDGQLGFGDRFSRNSPCRLECEHNFAGFIGLDSH